MKCCHIVGAGEMGGCKIAWKAGDLLIAADAGYTQVRRQGLKPDLVVGDFDSLGSVPEGEKIVRHPVMKDDTDMMLAVKLAFEAGCETFYLYGVLGGRLDHTLANLQTAMYIANRGGRPVLLGGDCCVTALHNAEIRFRPEATGVLSVFPLAGPARGVTLENLLYPLRDYTMESDVALGVSNEFIGKPAQAAVREGTLILVFPQLAFVEGEA